MTSGCAAGMRKAEAADMGLTGKTSDAPRPTIGLTLSVMLRASRFRSPSDRRRVDSESKPFKSWPLESGKTKSIRPKRVLARDYLIRHNAFVPPRKICGML